jgi:hypothetical protein
MALPLVLLAATGVFHVQAMEAESRFGANPIRKVVNMLKMMEQKVTEEGDKRGQLFEKYMCYCKKTTGDLTKSVATAEDQIPQLESSLEAATSMHQQLEEELKVHKTDRTDAEKAVETAIALRTKEQGNFAQESAESKANIAALDKAIAAITKGMGGFLQTSAASVLRKLSLSMDMGTSDRDLLSAYLTGGDSSSNQNQYSPQSGEITGILKTMLEEMKKELAEMTAEEHTAIANFEALVAAKKREIAASTKAIESKTARVGDLAVEKASLGNDLENTKDSLAEDTKFLAELSKTCAKTKVNFEEYQKSQSEELVALSETIKMLNDDDALDLFKKTLPSSSAAAASSFLQIQVTYGDMKRDASKVLRQDRNGDPRLDLVQLALNGQKIAFDKIMQKIQDLIQLLAEEQKEDDVKKDFCNGEIDKTEDELKAQKRAIADTQTVIAETKDTLAQVGRDIAALTAGIKGLDEEVKKATGTRKEENQASVEQLATNNAAKQLLDMAKKRLNKFYNPKLYKDAAGSLIEVQAHEQSDSDQPEAPPDLEHKKSGEAGGGVIQMLMTLKGDLEKSITVVEMEEKHAQTDYETFIEDSSTKRAIDTKAIASKESAKAEAEATIHKETGDLKVEIKSKKSIKTELKDLHEDCDWFLKNFDLRKEARADETDSLNKAKAVLSGADYS